jgi:hypothetical protein
MPRIIGRGIMWLLPRRRDSLSGIMMRVAVTMGLAAAAASVRRFRLLPLTRSVDTGTPLSLPGPGRAGPLLASPNLKIDDAQRLERKLCKRGLLEPLAPSF